VIVTDHHELPETLPDCVIVNPKLSDDYPYFAYATSSLQETPQSTVTKRSGTPSAKIPSIPSRERP